VARVLSEGKGREYVMYKDLKARRIRASGLNFLPLKVHVVEFDGAR